MGFEMTVYLLSDIKTHLTTYTSFGIFFRHSLFVGSIKSYINIMEIVHSHDQYIEEL